MCKFELYKHFICDKAVFPINPETGNKLPICVFYNKGECKCSKN